MKNDLTLTTTNLNQLFDAVFGTKNYLSNYLSDYNVKSPMLTIREDESNVYVESEVPGYKKEDVSVEFENGTLVVKGSKQNAANKNFSVSRFIGEDVDPTRAAAKIEDGVLNVTFSKVPASKPVAIAIA